MSSHRHLLFVLITAFLFLVLNISPCQGSSLPEVTNLHFGSDKETLSWDSLTGTEGYHVYSGLLSDLPSGNYGECLEGSIQGTSTAVADVPDPGSCIFYLVGGFDEEGDGTLGSGNPGPPRVPVLSCIPARRFFGLSSNGDPGDGVEDGVSPRRNPNAKLWSSSREKTGVSLHTGEFSLTSTDLWIPGRGFDWSFTRTYRSQITFNGPLGYNWDFKDNARLSPAGTDVRYLDGTGRSDQFYREDATHFTSPTGLYAVLIENEDGSFSLRYPHGTIMNFHALDGSNLEGALESIEDRHGNRRSYLYDHQGLLTATVDTLGRTADYEYDSLGRLISLTDYHGRSCVFTYDSNGDLTAARSPIVVGTPNGNDFPDGKTTGYTYGSGFESEYLNHNLLTVTAPNEEGSGPPLIQNSYETDTLLFHFDRVISQAIGGTNASGVPAGGTLTYSYTSLNPGSDPADPDIQRRQALVVDRNGNEEEHIHNFNGNLLQLTEFTNRNLRPGEPDYTMTYRFDADGEIIESHAPEANIIVNVYDKPGADRFREGNLLQTTFTPDPIVSGGRGDGHGAEAVDIVQSYTYDVVFNLIWSATDPRGNDTTYVPQNGGTQSAERYTTYFTYDYQEGDPATNGINDLAARFGIDLGTTSFNLGDLNGDGITDQASGKAVKIQYPTVNLDPGSNQASIQGDTTQEIVALYQYNNFSQLTAIIDPEENTHTFSYSPESDPDGDGTLTPPPPDGRTLDDYDGGYWVESFFDVYSSPGRNNGTNPDPTAIQYNYTYDPVGNRIGEIDGRGIRTRWIFNELNQVMEVRRSASTADATGPDGDPPTGRGETGLTPYSYKIRYEYDANDNVTGYDREDRDSSRGMGPYIEQTVVYDILDHSVELQREATATQTLTTQYRYDSNENLTEITQPVGNVHTQAFDERDLLLSRTRGDSGPRGGTASTTSWDYDGNGNITKITDGRGNLIDVLYDGFDRPVRSIDQVGNTIDLYFDPASNIVRQLWRGPVGGPTPTDRLGTTNVDIADARYLREELNRLFEYDLSLISAGSTHRPPILAEGSLMPSDGFINTIYEYDRLSRSTFHVRDSEATTRFDYDGVSRLLKRTDPGNNLLECTYDDNSNIIEHAETELSSSSGPPSELFLTTYFYDALDRRTRIVDNAGQTWDHLYDSLDAVITSTDPNGPLNGTINRRSPGHETMTATINSYGNVTNYTYDGLDRRIESKRVLTPSGQGDGTTNPTRGTSNPYNPDGEIILTYGWDDNSLLMDRTDDRGNITSYTYDNLDRVLTRTADDGTQWLASYDAMDNPILLTDSNGSEITSTFDNGNRRTQISVNRASGVLGTTLQTFEYDGLDRLTKGIDNNDPASTTDDVTVTFHYDSLGRLLEKSQSISDGTGTKYTDMGWLAENLQTDLIYPSGRNIQYSYDSADRMISVIDPSRSESASFNYFGKSRIHTRSYGNSLRSTMLNDSETADIGYDEVKRIINLRHLDGSNTLLTGFEHTYDRASNRLSVRRTHHGDGLGNYQGELYVFDSSNRLTSFQEGMLDSGLSFAGPMTDEQLWTLDGAGNWPEMTRNGVVYLGTPNNLNEYDEPQSGGTRVDDGIPDDFLDDAGTPGADGMNLAHDKNGNQINNGLFEIAYDFQNRPVKATRLSDGMHVATYTYDPVGNRISSEIINSGSLDKKESYFYGYLLPAASGKGGGGGGRIVPQGGGGQYTLGGGGQYIFGLGGGGQYMVNAEIENRDAADSVIRQVVVGPENGNWLWQIRADSSAQYNMEDALGSTAALSDGPLAAVLERVTYDAYGKPTIEDPNNVPILDPSYNYIAQSEFGNPNLFLGKRYDPELGSRTDFPNTDLGGYYYISPSSYHDPNQGRYSSRNYSMLRGGLTAAGNPYNFNGNAPVNMGGKEEFDLQPISSVIELITPDGKPPVWPKPPSPTFIFPGGGSSIKSAEDVAKKAVEAIRHMIRQALKRMLQKFKLSVKFTLIPEKNGEPIKVMFNPRPYSIQKSVPWEEKSKSEYFNFHDLDFWDLDTWDLWDFDFWKFDFPDPIPPPKPAPKPATGSKSGGAYVPDEMLTVLGFTITIDNAGTGDDPDSAWETCTGGALNIEIGDPPAGGNQPPSGSNPPEPPESGESGD